MTSVSIHRRYAYTCTIGDARVIKEVLEPLSFRRQMSKVDAREFDPLMFEGTDFESLPLTVSVTMPWKLMPSTAGHEKHPVTMPIFGVCGNCGARGDTLQPVLNAAALYQTVRLVSLNGIADVHICPIKCSDCGKLQKDAYGGDTGDTSWLLLHNVVPATTQRAEVVFEIPVLTLLASIEKSHGSFSIASAAATLIANCTVFERGVDGLPMDSSVTARSLRWSIDQVMRRWKAYLTKRDEIVHNRPEHCVMCVAAVEVHTTDACEKATLFFRKGGDFQGSGQHFSNGIVMGRASIDELQNNIYHV